LIILFSEAIATLDYDPDFCLATLEKERSHLPAAAIGLAETLILKGGTNCNEWNLKHPPSR
jgi:hypothetical protein